MSIPLVIVDTGAANIHSVAKAVRVAGGEPVVTQNPADLLNAHSAILPGVGAIDSVMRALNANNLPPAIREFARSGRPLLCVCIGMQVLMESSEEGDSEGLGIIGGNVKHLSSGKSAMAADIKVPHMGWNSVRFRQDGDSRHPAFCGIPESTHFYFVHSYHCVPTSSGDIAATTRHGGQFCAAIVRDNIVGTQFHPEKSGRIGIGIYRRFIEHSQSRNAY